MPEASGFECEFRTGPVHQARRRPHHHQRGSADGRPAATGVKVQTNTDPRWSEMADFGEWSRQQMQPPLPGELSGASRANTPPSGR